MVLPTSGPSKTSRSLVGFDGAGAVFQAPLTVTAVNGRAATRWRMAALFILPAYDVSDSDIRSGRSRKLDPSVIWKDHRTHSWDEPSLQGVVPRRERQPLCP